jgi:hypothetical protein
VPTAIAWGDVHLTTFDGLYYNFQAVGEFTLAKSTVAGDSYDVQIRTEQYSPGASVSVMNEIAVALGNQSVTFGINHDDVVYLNGTAQAMGVGSVLTINGDTVEELSASNFLVKWSTGESMTVNDGAIQAGITDPQLQQAAALDFIVTGDPNIVVGGQNAQQQGITTTLTNVAPAAVTTAVGVSANNAALVEST